ncbi:hypothetical protein GQ53DRAFT_819033 [Thozetella sp. PMI_491]|nr:hypothetical protein GQ53DRAFT_819033 [Thozetella sp. PMI_491]
MKAFSLVTLFLLGIGGVQAGARIGVVNSDGEIQARESYKQLFSRFIGFQNPRDSTQDKELMEVVFDIMIIALS